MAQDAEEFLNIDPLDFKVIDDPLLNWQINKFTPLTQRVEKENIDKLLS